MGVSYALTNYFGTSDPAGDIIGLIEARLTAANWSFVEEAAYTSGASARSMRVWKCPGTQNAAGTDFFVGFSRNTAGGTYLSMRAFEAWNATSKVMTRPAISGGLSAMTNSWSGVAYGAGTFVVVSTTGAIMYSTDNGVTWGHTATPQGAGIGLQTITYGAGLFVAFPQGNTNFCFTSPDGITWTQRSLPSTLTWNVAGFSNTPTTAKFIAAGSNSGATTTSYVYSTDGITWTTGTFPVVLNVTGLAYGSSGWVVLNQTSTTNYNSATGVTWTVGTALGTGQNWAGLAYGGTSSLYLAIGQSSTGYTGLSTSAWTARTLTQSGPWTSVVATGAGAGTFFVAIDASGSVQTSPDGATWTARVPLPSAGYTMLAYGGGTLMTPSNSSFVETSTDGSTWTQRTIPFPTGTTTGAYPPALGTLPSAVELSPSLAATTNYDVGVLASNSYVAIGINTNGTGTSVGGFVLGLYQPAYSDAQATNLPLLAITLNAAPALAPSGVSRALRQSASATNPFSACPTPETLMLGTFNSATKEPATQSIRACRVAVAGGSLNNGFTGAGFRGWLYDAIAVAQSVGTVKVGDGVTIGATTYNHLQQSANGAGFYATGSYAGYYFNPTAGS